MRIICLILTLFVSGSVLAQNRILVVDELRLDGSSLTAVQSVVSSDGNALVTAEALVNYVASQGGGSGYSVFDTTFASNGNDFSVGLWPAILTNPNEVRMDVVLQSGASSDAQISLPPAAIYPGKKIVLSAVNSSSNSITVFGAGNSSPAFTLSNGQAVTLVSMNYNDVAAWVLIGHEGIKRAANITADTIAFTQYAEYNPSVPFSGDTLVVDSVGAIPGTYIYVHVDTDSKPIISGANSIIETGQFEPDTLNIYHFLWSGAGGYMLAIQSVEAVDTTPVNPPSGDTVLTFLTTAMTTSGNYDYLASGANYADSYAVTTDSLTGDFSIEIDIGSVTYEHSMFGLSLTPTNVRWNDGVNPWRIMIFLSSISGATTVAENGSSGTIDNSVTATYQAGDVLRFERVSGVIKAYFNTTEIHDFGTVNNVLYFNMSNFTSRSVKLNNNFTGFSTQN